MKIADVPIEDRLLWPAEYAAARAGMDYKAFIELLERGRIAARQMKDGTWRINPDDLRDGLRQLAAEETAMRITRWNRNRPKAA